VLHNNIGALEVLLQHGCAPYPPKPKVNSGKRTSGAIEFPVDICERLYGDSNVGKEIKELLEKYTLTDLTTG
jgi:hypothetical protein